MLQGVFTKDLITHFRHAAGSIYGRSDLMMALHTEKALILSAVLLSAKIFAKIAEIKRLSFQDFSTNRRLLNFFIICTVGWTDWGPWTSCNRLGCSVGIRSRERMCVDGVAGDSECPGSAQENVYCEVELCSGKKVSSKS